MTRAAIKHGEERLRSAILASDVAELDALLSEDVIFCLPTGVLVRKADDLAAYRSGAQKVTRYEPSELVIELYGAHGDSAWVSVRVELAGTAGGRPFAGAHRYTRAWTLEAGVWRVVGGSACAIV